jgi:hypothetical protein
MHHGLVAVSAIGIDTPRHGLGMKSWRLEKVKRGHLPW